MPKNTSNLNTRGLNLNLSTSAAFIPIQDIVRLGQDNRADQKQRFEDVDANFAALSQSYDELTNIPLGNKLHRKEMEGLLSKYRLTKESLNIDLEGANATAKTAAIKSSTKALANDLGLKRILKENAQGQQFIAETEALEAVNPNLARTARKAYMDKFVNRDSRPLDRPGFDLSIAEFQPLDVNAEIGSAIDGILAQDAYVDTSLDATGNIILVKKGTTNRLSEDDHREFMEDVLASLNSNPQFKNNFDTHVAANGDFTYGSEEGKEAVLASLVENLLKPRITDISTQKISKASGSGTNSDGSPRKLTAFQVEANSFLVAARELHSEYVIPDEFAAIAKRLVQGGAKIEPINAVQGTLTIPGNLVKGEEPTVIILERKGISDVNDGRGIDPNSITGIPRLTDVEIKSKLMADSTASRKVIDPTAAVDVPSVATLDVGSLAVGASDFGGVGIVKARKGVRANADGSESSHLMRTETDGKGNWFSFPTLFQDDDGTWIDMSEQSERNWKPAFDEAKKRGELVEFGEDKDSALKFGEGAWKEQSGQQVVAPPIDITGVTFDDGFLTGDGDEDLAELGVSVDAGLVESDSVLRNELELSDLFSDNLIEEINFDIDNPRPFRINAGLVESDSVFEGRLEGLDEAELNDMLRVYFVDPGSSSITSAQAKMVLDRIGEPRRGSSVLSTEFVAAIEEVESGSALRIRTDPSSSDYDTLLNNEDLPGGEFSDFKASTKTVDEIIEFTKGGSDYGKFSIKFKNRKDNEGRFQKSTLKQRSTPVGKHQITGTSLKDAVKAGILSKDDIFTPENQDKVAEFLAKRSLKGKKTSASKRKALKGVWEGFHKLSDERLDKIIKGLE